MRTLLLLTALLSLTVPTGAAPPGDAKETAGEPAAIPAPPDVAGAPADVTVTASGMATKVLAPGTGMQPGPTDTVKVHYTGWTTDGKMFDSSVAHGKPAVLPLDKVIAGWTEGIQLMVEGETRRFWIPKKLGSGSKQFELWTAGYLVIQVDTDINLFAHELKFPACGARRARGAPS